MEHLPANRHHDPRENHRRRSQRRRRHGLGPGRRVTRPSQPERWIAWPRRGRQIPSSRLRGSSLSGTGIVVQRQPSRAAARLRSTEPTRSGTTAPPTCPGARVYGLMGALPRSSTKAPGVDLLRSAATWKPGSCSTSVPAPMHPKSSFVTTASLAFVSCASRLHSWVPRPACRTIAQDPWRATAPRWWWATSSGGVPHAPTSRGLWRHDPSGRNHRPSDCHGWLHGCTGLAS
jgi:hypothetical protein